jgi:hypothetical protein
VDPPANPRASGADISGTVRDVDGDIVGGDKTMQSAPGQSVWLSVPRDPSLQEVVRLLGLELEGRRREIDGLQAENKNLTSAKIAIDGAFGMVRLTIGEHFLSASEFIWLTCQFIRENKLQTEFCHSLPPDMLKAAKENG